MLARVLSPPIKTSVEVPLCIVQDQTSPAWVVLVFRKGCRIVLPIQSQRAADARTINPRFEIAKIDAHAALIRYAAMINPPAPCAPAAQTRQQRANAQTQQPSIDLLTKPAHALITRPARNTSHPPIAPP